MTRQFTDQMKRQITLSSFPPKRIISLVPSQTELLFYLGLEEEVLGITKFCIHPEAQYKKKIRVGGTKKIHIHKIDALQPDLIIGNKEENQQEQIEELAQKYPVWMSDIQNLEDALDMIKQIGILTNRKVPALQLSQDIQNGFRQLEEANRHLETPKRAAYFIWRKPYMLAAKNTFIDEMLHFAGFSNVLNNKTRYPEFNINELAALAPEVILLSSEPYPFKARHLEELQEICPNAVIKLVDGELFSWYGNRLLHAVPYFFTLRKEFYGQKIIEI